MLLPVETVLNQIAEGDVEHRDEDEEEDVHCKHDGEHGEDHVSVVVEHTHLEGDEGQGRDICIDDPGFSDVAVIIGGLVGVLVGNVHARSWRRQK